MASQKIRVSLASIWTTESKGSTYTNHENEKGLHWVVTGLFLIGDLAGGGLVALPTAMMQSDFYPGMILTAVMTFIFTYTAYVLGQSWVMLQRRWPEYRDHCRKPYPEMGERAMGPMMGSVVTVCIDVTQFGIAIVYLLLSAKNIHDFLRAFFETDFSYCYVILVLGVCLLPITFLKSPQDFWQAVVIGMFTTAAAVVLIVIGASLDYKTCAPVMATNHKFKATNYFLALGTLLFSYGGHAAFPTIQHDMRKPYHFTRAVIFAFTSITTMYYVVSVMGFITYGNSLQSSIINSLQTTSIQQAVNVLITIHCILTLTIVFNPLNQDIEELFNVPHHFCWQRALVRTGVMVAVVFVSESVPSFGPLLELVGGSTLTMTALIFPCLFYLYISVAEDKSVDGLEKGCDPLHHTPPTFFEVIRKTPKARLILCGFVITFGIIGGCAATYSAINELATTQFIMPCYVQPFLKDKVSEVSHHTNCCGRWQNVSVSGNPSHCGPYMDFYGQGNIA